VGELTAAQALRLSSTNSSSVIVLAGVLSPYSTQPWGISETYYPANLPEALRRGQGTPAASVSDFYTHWLHDAVSPSEPWLVANEEEAASAEHLAGVSDKADVALVVQWHHVPRLQSLFTGLSVRRFESAGDCWTSSVRRTIHAYRYDEVCVCQTRYRRLVDTTTDNELWALPEGAAAWGARAPSTASLLSIDVLVHADSGTPASVLIDALSRRGWAGRVGPAGDWLTPGKRVEAASMMNPRIAVTSHMLARFSQLNLFGSGLPLQCELTLSPPIAERQMLAFQSEAEEAVLTIAATHWLTHPLPVVEVLRRVSAEEAEEELAPRDAVLPLSPVRALQWMLDGTITSGAAALVDSCGCHTFTPRLPAGCEHMDHTCLDGSDACFSQLAANGVASARIIAFYCNHGSSSSHKRAAAYALWAHGAGGAEAGVEPQQRIMVIAGGGAGLSRAALDAGMDMDAMFRSYDPN